MPRKKKSLVPSYVYPTCVRHAAARKDVRLRHYFMCDKCAGTWTKDAFDGNKSLYDGEETQGYCLLCNQDQKVRLRTWFLCDICHRVAASIGRNHVAELAIMAFWEEQVRPKFPGVKLVRNDVSALRPKRKTDVSASAPIDFLAVSEESGANLFGIENKTGRSSIKQMSKFQLDVSDCDTILNDLEKLKIPAYIIHAQVLEIWKPPTVGFHIQGLWWTDVYRMTEHFKAVKQRSDENRGAAYFNKKAFNEIDTFADEVAAHNLIRQFNEKGPPAMYVIAKSIVAVAEVKKDIKTKSTDVAKR